MSPEYKRPTRKLHEQVDRTWRVELLYDNPYFTENKFQGKVLKSAKFALKDIETNEEFTVFFGADSKVVKKLLNHKRGDRLELTYRTGINKHDKPITWYDVYGLGQTPDKSRRSFQPIPDRDYKFQYSDGSGIEKNPNPVLDLDDTDY